MGYAVLVFPPASSAGQILKGVLKVIMGETNLANIEGLSTAPSTWHAGYVSEIYNPSGHAWTLEYPAALPVTGNFGIQVACLKSECLTAGKFKRVRFMIANSVNAFTEPTGPAANANAALTSGYHINLQGLTSINTSTGATTNLSFRNTNQYLSQGIRCATATELIVVKISWSNRHLLLSQLLQRLNVTNGGLSTSFGCFEFDENNLTQYSNSAPCIYLSAMGTDSTTAVASLPTLVNITANTNLNYDTAENNYAQILGTFNPTTSTTPSSRAIVNTFTTHTLDMNNRRAFNLASHASTEHHSKKFFMNNRFEIATSPIFVDDRDGALGIINCSKYSRIFLYFNHTADGELVTSAINGAQYKVWNINTYIASLTAKEEFAYSTIIVPYS